MPSWHPPDSDSVSVQDDESIIKVHNDAKTRFSWIWPFGIWTTMPGEVKDPTSLTWNLEMCNLLWTPPLLEKDNSKNNPVLNTQV